MPLCLAPSTRREFLRHSLAGAGALALSPAAWAGRGADSGRYILFSDTHISAEPGATDGGINMTDHLKQAVAEVTALDRRPAGVLINGDCAYHNGLPGDYTQLVQLLQPVHEARLHIHFLLGNHDDRANIRQGIAETTGTPLVADKLAYVVKTAHANLFMLDSLDRTNVTPGVLGDGQVRWLARALDRHSDRPAIIIVHHQPGYKEFGAVGGLRDTEALMSVLAPRTHVKAIFFGHTHHWLVAEREGIHCVNLPPVAYVFDPKDPSGWVDMRLREYGMTLRFNALDKSHNAHGEEHRLDWR